MSFWNNVAKKIASAFEPKVKDKSEEKNVSTSSVPVNEYGYKTMTGQVSAFVATNPSNGAQYPPREDLALYNMDKEVSPPPEAEKPKKKGFFGNLIDKAANIVNKVTTAIGGTIETTKTKAADFINDVKTVVTTALDQVKETVTNAVNKAVETMSDFLGIKDPNDKDYINNLPAAKIEEAGKKAAENMAAATKDIVASLPPEVQEQMKNDPEFASEVVKQIQDTLYEKMTENMPPALKERINSDPALKNNFHSSFLTQFNNTLDIASLVMKMKDGTLVQEVDPNVDSKGVNNLQQSADIGTMISAPINMSSIAISSMSSAEKDKMANSLKSVIGSLDDFTSVVYDDNTQAEAKAKLSSALKTLSSVITEKGKDEKVTDEKATEAIKIIDQVFTDGTGKEKLKATLSPLQKDWEQIKDKLGYGDEQKIQKSI